MLKIRKFSPNDIEQILEISRVSFAAPWPKKEFEKYYKESFVAEDDGKISGFAVGKISGERAVLKLIAVSPDYRGKGAAKGLIEHIFGHFAEKNAREIIAHSRLHNKEGCSFLKGLGFEPVKTIKNYYNGEDAYLMIKKLR